MPISPALRRVRQEDPEFRTILTGLRDSHLKRQKKKKALEIKNWGSHLLLPNGSN